MQEYNDELANQPWVEVCVCKKQFMQPNSYAVHIRSCAKFRAQYKKTLNNARERQRQPEDTPESSSTGSTRKKRKRPTWLDEEDLEIDQPLPGKKQNELEPPNVAPPTVIAPPATSVANESEELGRGRRLKTLSCKVRKSTDFEPSSALPPSLFREVILERPPAPAPVIAEPDTSPGPTPKSPEMSGESQTHHPAKTLPNSFGLYKAYEMCQTGDSPHDPDATVTPEDLREEQAPIEPQAPKETSPNLFPFPNLSSFRLGEWFWSDDAEKSQESFQKLVSIVGDHNFKPEDVRGTNWKTVNNILAQSQYEEGPSSEWEDDGGISWITRSITVPIPFSKTSAIPGVHSYTLPTFHYRSLTEIIRAKLECPIAQENFHTMGFDLRWCPGEGKEDVRTYGEMYTSKAFIDAYEELQRSPREEGCNLPRFVIGLMFASDATQLAAFGSAKVWPLYLFFANDSKYKRSKPSEKLFETIAYFERLPDDFKDFFIKHTGQAHLNKAHEALMTHCHREMFHAQWSTILDGDFVHAYRHGIVVKCHDNVDRRFYPRILTYSADYPEKILIASIKNLGTHLCPRCEVTKADVPAMGQKRDLSRRVRLARVDNSIRRERVEKAREFLYDKKYRYSILSKAVEGRLAHGSLVATDNAFSKHLSAFGFNLFPMLVVDILHEVEIGVWKALFLHLLRLLEAAEKGLVNTLDKRYRDLPTFGRDTIRRFVNNVSEMKQFAARDFEDLLQCAIPAFDGLLPAPHNNHVMRLLFIFAHWHGLAKLRLHTDHTLTMLEEETVRLGEAMRRFEKETCSAIVTTELQREYQARKRREASAQKKRSLAESTSKGTKKRKLNSGEAEVIGPENAGDDVGSQDGLRAKTLNLNTYKYHALGDVAPCIRLFGTTDSYSTQIPERFHRYPKIHYKRTSKKKVNRQLSRIQARQARIKKLRKQIVPADDEKFVHEDTFTNPYFIGKSQSSPVSLPVFIQSKSNDAAVKDFMPKLRAHLLPRVYKNLLLEEHARNKSSDGGSNGRLNLIQSLIESSEKGEGEESTAARLADADRIFFHSDRIYEHQILHINFTSYDVRRETDILNPKTSRKYVMCLRQPDPDDPCASPHRFMHAQVLGVYHANIIYRGTGAADLRKRRMDFLWVRWFEFVHPAASTTGLDRVQLLPLKHKSAVGFLDPADVLRASYIAPRFTLGRRYTETEKSTRIASKITKDNDDWHEYYVNRFVDRDMVMRYHWGHGVGHSYSHIDAPEASPASQRPALVVTGDVDTPPEAASEHDPESGVPVPELLPLEGDDGEEDDGANPHEHTLHNLEEEELDTAGPDDDDELEDREGADTDDTVQDPEDDEDSGGE